MIFNCVSFQISDSVLGSGKFSMVYKATVADRPVAVKVPKRGCPKQEFKLMLTELKIMARTGFHVNILTFHGAYTKDIRKGMNMFIPF